MPPDLPRFPLLLVPPDIHLLPTALIIKYKSITLILISAIFGSLGINRVDWTWGGKQAPGLLLKIGPAQKIM